MNNNFTKADLKDGMIVKYRNGKERLLVGEYLYEVETFGYRSVGRLTNFKENLTGLFGDNELDIIQVSYMGETLWKRKELYTLGELYDKWEKGEVIKYTLIQGPDFITELYNVWKKINDVYCYDRKIKYATERVWEIVE